MGYFYGDGDANYKFTVAVDGDVTLSLIQKQRHSRLQCSNLIFKRSSGNRTPLIIL